MRFYQNNHNDDSLKKKVISMSEVSAEKDSKLHFSTSIPRRSGLDSEHSRTAAEKRN